MDALGGMVSGNPEELGGEILRICIRSGGSITGEHGVGKDKVPYMAEMFGEADLETMGRVRCAFDAENRFNPGKVFPTPRLCGDRPGPYRAHPAETSGAAGGDGGLAIAADFETIGIAGWSIAKSICSTAPAGSSS